MSIVRSRLFCGFATAGSGGAQQCLYFKDVHRWLGILWPHNLGFAAALHDIVARASCACAPLVGLVTSGAIPITLAMEIFEVKVDSVLRFGRWLYALSHEATSCFSCTSEGTLATGTRM